MKLVFATNNTHKLQEVRQILPAAYELLSLQDIGFEEEIDETGDTLEANSQLKAQVVMDFLRTCPSNDVSSVVGVMADDTGLEVAALGGAPGVYSARYAGEPSNSERNRAKLLEAMRPYSEGQRDARFRTVITMIYQNGKVLQVDGVVTGEIAQKEQGDGGFGYDSLFIPTGYDCTFAQLSAEEKNAISHRGRAVQNLRKYLD